jgi:hypothetical protein
MNELDKLKSNYKKKYVTPLLFRFTRPPKLFDEQQIRLRKQIEKFLDKLDVAEICPECKGKGVIFHEVKMVLKEKPLWNSPFVGALIDSRAYTNDMCFKCFGEGIIFGKDNETKIAKFGLIISHEQIDDLVCDVCNKDLDWNLEYYDRSPGLKASCHGIQYRVISKVLKVETINCKSDKKNDKPAGNKSV